MDALTIAALSLQNDIDRVANVGHNLTNLTTPGYRRIVESGQAFRYAGLHAGAMSLLTSGHPAASAIDTLGGGVTGTGNTTDLAIEGDGFFELKSPDGSLVTRRGDFHVDSDSRLVSSEGYPVLGQNGDITVTSSAMRIEADGRIFDGDRLVDQLRIVNVADHTALIAQGNSLFRTDQALVSDAKDYRIRQGFLEGSNVNSATEMIKLIELVKHIESNQKVLQYQDEMMGKALGKFAEL